MEPRELHMIFAFVLVVIVANVAGVVGAMAHLNDLIDYAGSLGVVGGAITFFCLHLRAANRHRLEPDPRQSLRR
jgi:hypothetical protein